jgi:hypothetical protein
MVVATNAVAMHHTAMLRLVMDHTIFGTLANAVPDMRFTEVDTAFRVEFMATHRVSSDRTSVLRVCLDSAAAVARRS